MPSGELTEVCMPGLYCLGVARGPGSGRRPDGLGRRGCHDRRDGGGASEDVGVEHVVAGIDVRGE
eukprot:5064180-Heterocapsa_arctica.AAC.1